jgi:hypothetical protein
MQVGLGRPDGRRDAERDEEIQCRRFPVGGELDDDAVIVAAAAAAAVTDNVRVNLGRIGPAAGDNVAAVTLLW